jgi:hypothetical protein
MILPLCGIFLSAAAWAETPQTVPVPPLPTVTFKSGEWLLTKCGSGQQQDQATCLGFVMGSTDAVTVATAFGGACGTFRVCRPAQVTDEQVRDVILKYLEAHPAERSSSSAVALAARALAAAWPCR